MIRPLIATFLALALALSASPNAQAQPRLGDGPGLRIGISDDPDTLFLGFLYGIPIADVGSSVFLIEPGVDVGFGDDVDFFTIRGSANGKFLFPVGAVALYPLVGLSLYYLNVDRCGRNDFFGDDCDHLGVGLNLGGGINFDRFNLELILGVNDVPDLSLSFGIFF